MNYSDALKSVIAIGNITDGYNGNREVVLFSLIGNRVVTVANCGCFNSGLPDVIDEKEALWILQNHPLAKNIKNIVEFGMLTPYGLKDVPLNIRLSMKPRLFKAISDLQTINS